MTTEHFDVLVIGAGLSGIGAGYRLQEQCPGKSYAILESREAIGGTWDLFKYPGLRSDSDMYTLGYPFRPWKGEKAIADGADILSYIRETASENGIDRQIRFCHRVLGADWSSADARWTVRVERTDTGEALELTCGFLYSCTGYYDYEAGYTPEFEGVGDFGGEVVHPQKWTDDVDYEGKRVVVIGSGATAVTLVPAIAERAAHVTMLQRSPTYIFSLPAVDPLSRLLRRLLPERVVYSIMRWRNVIRTAGSWEISRRWPWIIKTAILRAVRRQLPKDFDIETHFTPTYNPWDQRICAVPDGDLFKAIRAGTASVVTDRIARFTEKGLLLESGAELEADMIVTATGLNMLLLGGVELTVDGESVDFPEHTMYRGTMFDRIPNLAQAMGYTNASFTLKCDLTNRYVCRLLNHMDANGYSHCAPGALDPAIERIPAIDFSSGYVQRSIDKFPRQGSKVPWRLYQNYPRDIRTLARGELEDGVMEFFAAQPAAEHRRAVAA